MNLRLFSIFATAQFCLSLEDDDKKAGNEIAKISDWWKKMSNPKPVKCNKNNSDKEKLAVEESIWKLYENIKYVVSSPCTENELGSPFEIRGKSLTIVDGRLEGTGKLILHKSWPTDTSFEVMNSTCITLRLDGQGNQPSEIVGTFVNGLMEGNAKIKLSDNYLIISQFLNGHLHGFTREWNNEGRLQKIGNFYRNVPVSNCWKMFLGRLIYEDCSMVQRPDEPTGVVLSLHESENYFTIGGRLNPIALRLENIYDVIISEVSPVDDCFLRIVFEPKTMKNENFDISSGKFHRTAYSESGSLCRLKTEDESLDASKILNHWLELVTTKNKTNPFDTLDMMKPVSEEVDKTKALVLIPEVKLGPNMNQKLNISILNGKPTTFSLTVISLDSDNRCHGYCELKLDESGNLDDVGSDPTLGWKPISIKGEFTHGLLNGHCLIDFMTNRWLYGIAKDGVLHGPVFIDGVTNIMPDRLKIENVLDHQGIGFLGIYKNGRAVGQVWIGMKGGGHLHGKVDDTTGLVSGDHIAYIYPDKETALLGKFENRIMKRGQESTVLEVGCNDDGILVVTKFAKPTGPIFYFGPPTNVSWGSGPPGVSDPYERKWLQLRPSQIPKSGEGIFLLRDAPANQVVAFIGGFFFDEPLETKLYYDNCVNNVSKSDEYRRACKKYSIPVPSHQTFIHIPPEADGSGDTFPAIGQKINHHFRLDNTEFSEFEHPRWGPMPCVITTVAIKAGQELFADYGYEQAPFPDDFPWYWETKSAIEKEERLKKEKEEDELTMKKVKEKRKTKTKSTKVKKIKNKN